MVVPVPAIRTFVQC